jgi:DNA-binding GntR family transcriptional regulator
MPESNTKKTAEARNTSEVLARDVVRGLYEGRYVPGQRLVEPDLMAQFGVGRSTVREALKKLVSEGIVVSHPFRGAQIRNLSRGEAVNLFAITEVILGLAARQAAQNPDAGKRKAIVGYFKGIERFREEFGRFEFLKRRNDFFRALVDIAGNEEILRIIPGLQVNLIRNVLVISPKERIEAYGRIANAVVEGEGEAAERAARDYVSKVANLTLPHFAE